MMTWLGLSVALADAGCDLSLLGGPACGPAAGRDQRQVQERCDRRRCAGPGRGGCCTGERWLASYWLTMLRHRRAP